MRSFDAGYAGYESGAREAVGDLFGEKAALEPSSAAGG